MHRDIRWVFNQAGDRLLVFAGEGHAGSSQTVSISNARIRIRDSLGNELPVEIGRLVIDNRAPYVAVGDNPEESLRSAQSRPSADV